MLDALAHLSDVRDATVVYVAGYPSLLTVEMGGGSTAQPAIEALKKAGFTVVPVSRMDRSLSDR